MMREPMQAYVPSAADPFDLRKVSHLLRRAGFAASLRVRKGLVRQGLDAAIAHVLRDDADPEAQAWHDTAVTYEDIDKVRAYRVWLALRARRPLRERLAYFWHDHFATSNAKIRSPRQMAEQQQTFDRLGAGSFDRLCAAMCRDPALLRWLDNDVNTDANANENFARELFELFTLGRGAYTEQDVREAARCFTGWHVRRGRFKVLGHLHDRGEKALFGQRGAFDGDDVLRLTLPRRESSAFLADKWLRWFVHPEPEAAEVDALADVYEHHQRRVAPTLATLLRSRLFFSERAWRSKVKSPAEFTIGTVRLLSARAAPTALARTMAELGETWLEPPSVEDWHRERAWLSEAAWLLRSNFVADLLAGRSGKLAPQPGAAFSGLHRADHFARMASLLLLDGAVRDDDFDRLVAVAERHADDDHDRRAAAVLHAAACLPEYQLL
jgi:uncharacterized protein (DUF1800 family)